MTAQSVQIDSSVFPKSLLRHFEGKTILVTGASGLIGGNLVAVLSKLRCCLLMLSRRAGPPPSGRAECHMFVGDIRDQRVLEQATDRPVDAVFHLAAQTSASFANQTPLEDLEINCAGTLRLLETIAGRQPPTTVILASTASVVGLTTAADGAIGEGMKERPATIYDVDKLAAEHYVRLYTANGRIRGASLRLSNVYGGGLVKADNDRGILNKLIINGMRGEPVWVFSPGNWIRDYIHVSDVVGAFLHAAVHVDRLCGEPYFVGSGQGIALKDAFAIALESVAAKTGKRNELRFRDPPANLGTIEFRDFVADTSAFENKTGWHARHDLRSGIDRTVATLIDQAKEPRTSP